MNDGIYSIAATAESGASILLLKIENGTICGNDTSGARYRGTISEQGDGNLRVSLEVTFPTGSFGIWGTSPGETFQTRRFDADVPGTFFNERVPFTLPGYDMTLTAVRVPDDVGFLADDDGLDQYIDALSDVQRAWAAHDAA
ncbi:hypothetical protein [Mesorhizobium sp. L103C119B0]|uniref:hypothetical protein n=1 Tax=Mesorhizobium sp. L103C119B0 TaxID=1287085 RepID=UPI0012DE2D47|nr:hypothetical protein [Mesorhizobium sp. L103C119B0]